jgi:hypothetical protein
MTTGLGVAPRARLPAAALRAEVFALDFFVLDRAGRFDARAGVRRRLADFTMIATSSLDPCRFLLKLL